MKNKKLNKIALIIILSIVIIAILAGIGLIVLTVMITVASPRQYMDDSELIENNVYIEDTSIEYIEEEPYIKLCDFNNLYIDYENNYVIYKTDSQKGILEIPGCRYPRRSERVDDGLMFSFYFPDGIYDITITTYMEDDIVLERVKVPNVYVMENGSTSELKEINDINFLVLKNDVTGSLNNISHLTFLRGLYIDSQKVHGLLKDISNLTALEYLSLDTSNGIIGDIEVLNEMYNLRYLNISCYDGINGMVSSLSHLTKIEYLKIIAPNIPCSISAIGQLTELRYLWVSIYINDNNENNNAIANLTQLENMTVFVFDDINLDIANFSQLTNLKKLHIFCAGLTGDISSLSELTNLIDLEISDNNVTGNINSLENMVYMDRLTIERCDVAGDISSLSAMTSLRDLHITDTQITGDIAVFAYDDFSRLEGINLQNTPIYGSMKSMSMIKNLRFLRLNNTSIEGDIAYLGYLEKSLIVEVENSPDIFGEVTLSNDKIISIKNGNSEED